VVGTYNNLVVRGNKRVNIIWTRVIRPDGIDIMIRSPGTDQLGTAGVEGVVDNKYLETFSAAFLISAINIAIGIGTDEITNSDSTTTTDSNGSSTTTTSNPGTQAAVLQAVDLFGGAGKSIIDSALNLGPTITIEQGTRVSIFVNRDLIFPLELINQVQVIQ
jgi:type IV secretion system protein VirB10